MTTPDTSKRVIQIPERDAGIDLAKQRVTQSSVLDGESASTHTNIFVALEGVERNKSRNVTPDLRQTLTQAWDGENGIESFLLQFGLKREYVLKLGESVKTSDVKAAVVRTFYKIIVEVQEGIIGSQDERIQLLEGLIHQANKIIVSSTDASEIQAKLDAFSQGLARLTKNYTTTQQQIDIFIHSQDYLKQTPEQIEKTAESLSIAIINVKAGGAHETFDSTLMAFSEVLQKGLKVSLKEITERRKDVVIANSKIIELSEALTEARNNSENQAEIAKLQSELESAQHAMKDAQRRLETILFDLNQQKEKLTFAQFDAHVAERERDRAQTGESIALRQKREAEEKTTQERLKTNAMKNERDQAQVRVTQLELQVKDLETELVEARKNQGGTAKIRQLETDLEEAKRSLALTKIILETAKVALQKSEAERQAAESERDVAKTEAKDAQALAEQAERKTQEVQDRYAEFLQGGEAFETLLVNQCEDPAVLTKLINLEGSLNANPLQTDEVKKMLNDLSGASFGNITEALYEITDDAGRNAVISQLRGFIKKVKEEYQKRQDAKLKAKAAADQIASITAEKNQALKNLGLERDKNAGLTQENIQLRTQNAELKKMVLDHCNKMDGLLAESYDLLLELKQALGQTPEEALQEIRTTCPALCEIRDTYPRKSSSASQSSSHQVTRPGSSASGDGNAVPPRTPDVDDFKVTRVVNQAEEAVKKDLEGERDINDSKKQKGFKIPTWTASRPYEILKYPDQQREGEGSTVEQETQSVQSPVVNSSELTTKLESEKQSEWQVAVDGSADGALVSISFGGQSPLEYTNDEHIRTIIKQQIDLGIREKKYVVLTIDGVTCYDSLNEEDGARSSVIINIKSPSLSPSEIKTDSESTTIPEVMIDESQSVPNETVVPPVVVTEPSVGDDVIIERRNPEIGLEGPLQVIEGERIEPIVPPMTSVELEDTQLSQKDKLTPENVPHGIIVCARPKKIFRKNIMPESLTKVERIKEQYGYIISELRDFRDQDIHDQERQSFVKNVQIHLRHVFLDVEKTGQWTVFYQELISTKKALDVRVKEPSVGLGKRLRSLFSRKPQNVAETTSPVTKVLKIGAALAGAALAVDGVMNPEASVVGQAAQKLAAWQTAETPRKVQENFDRVSVSTNTPSVAEQLKSNNWIQFNEMPVVFDNDGRELSKDIVKTFNLTGKKYPLNMYIFIQDANKKFVEWDKKAAATNLQKYYFKGRDNQGNQDYFVEIDSKKIALSQFAGPTAPELPR